MLSRYIHNVILEEDLALKSKQRRNSKELTNRANYRNTKLTANYLRKLFS